MNKIIDNSITDEQINDSIRKLNNTIQQATAINSSTLSSALSSVAQVALDNQKIQVDALAETLSLAHQGWIESLTNTFEIIYDLANSLDIQHNSSILKELISDVIDTETLTEASQSLNEISDEISESTDIFKIIKFLSNAFNKGSITVDAFMGYVEFIKFILGMLGVSLPGEDEQQVINIYGDINIQSETCNHMDDLMEIIEQITNEEPRE